MLAPHELKSKSFSKSLKGYNPSEVDDYIEFLIDKYTELYRENSELERKLRIVVTNFDEIRDEEEAIRSTLLKSQKLGEKIIRDANERAAIQYGTSLCYPLSMMSCHVSICPNHGTHRTAPFSTRGDIAHLGATGYELDTTQITPGELAQIKGQVDAYKRMSDLVLTGDLYRLDNPFESNYFTEEITSKDKTRSVITCYRRLAEVNPPVKRVYPKGLDPDFRYFVEEQGVTLSGSTIMNAGIIPAFADGDFVTVVFHLEKAD